VIWFGQQKILYGGCLVKSTENKDLGYIADANLGAWAPAIRRVMAKYPKPSFVIPGHFDWTSNRAMGHTRKLLQKKR
jgi:hypothetical protein